MSQLSELNHADDGLSDDPDVAPLQRIEIDRALTALDMARLGAVWLDDAGQLLQVDAAATRVLAIGAGEARRRGIAWDSFRPEAADGTPVTVVELMARDRVERHVIVLTDATGGAQTVLLESHPPSVARWSGRREQLLLLRPAAQPETSGPADGRTAATATSVRVLAAVDLTPREREIVELLLDGYRVGSIAPRLYLSTHTIRNHLKSVFRKAGVSSQAELIELVRQRPVR